MRIVFNSPVFNEDGKIVGNEETSYDADQLGRIKKRVAEDQKKDKDGFAVVGEKEEIAYIEIKFKYYHYTETFHFGDAESCEKEFQRIQTQLSGSKLSEVVN